jgi:hypothetical protein
LKIFLIFLSFNLFKPLLEMIFEDLRRNKEEDWAHKKPDNVSLGIVEETKQWHIFKDAYLDKVAVDY